MSTRLLILPWVEDIGAVVAGVRSSITISVHPRAALGSREGDSINSRGRGELEEEGGAELEAGGLCLPLCCTDGIFLMFAIVPTVQYYMPSLNLAWLP